MVKSPAPCFECGQPALVRAYGEDLGLADEWSCTWCDRTYDMPAYWLAVRALLEASAAKRRSR